ncbi:hypothetical protein QJS10_CPA06g00301 [Acorus calamus]|uniref:SLH domain-containing protein n=1 Tax=Acorus calamus TaxID=4465 RepID=A0AAV9EMP5_ACOCL|nr:hypothetical protein QJS10_CPA06g00301 [Acorus calamus]
MACLTIHSSPNAIRMKLGPRFRKSSPIHLCMRLLPSCRRSNPVSASSAAEDDDDVNGKSWMNSDSSDGLAGWFGADSGDGSWRKPGFAGVMGAGVAAVIFAVGVAFASFSFRSRGVKQQMEPLTSQQDVLLNSDDSSGKEEQVSSDTDEIIPNKESLENNLKTEYKTDSFESIDTDSKIPIATPPEGISFPDNVIEADVRPGDVCTRREYARWLVSTSGALSRNSASKVYPAMYIENVTQLAFDDITSDDPDFASIQGLAEAGLIQSRLSGYELNDSLDGEQGSIRFFPESPLSRQDLVSWKMALEKSRLQEVDKKTLYQCSGYIDIDRINPDAWPALVADLSAGEQGITALAFGYTRLFQPNKPVTKAQAAIALATGDAAEVVGEELARIEAESMAETAAATHTALVAQVENDLNASFEKELAREREKIDAVEKLAEEARQELEKLRAEREEENNALLRGQAAVESEMEVLSRLRGAVEEQLQSLMSNKIEISYERERINKLREEVESENQVIVKLQYELEVERKALSTARAWAEEEARRAREQAKALEEARERWERHGIKVIVDSELCEDANVGTAWPNAGKPSLVDGAINRSENLVVKLKAMAPETKGRSLAAIETVIQKVTVFISVMKRHASEAAAIAAGRARELQSTVVSKANESTEEFRQNAVRVGSSVKEGATRIVGDCRESIERITQRFKT